MRSEELSYFGLFLGLGKFMRAAVIARLQFMQSPQSAIPVEDFFARHASVISFDTAQNPPIVCFASALRDSLGFALVDHRLLLNIG